jgi:hypothetical protein
MIFYNDYDYHAPSLYCRFSLLFRDEQKFRTLIFNIAIYAIEDDILPTANETAELLNSLLEYYLVLDIRSTFHKVYE